MYRWAPLRRGIYNGNTDTTEMIMHWVAAKLSTCLVISFFLSNWTWSYKTIMALRLFAWPQFKYLYNLKKNPVQMLSKSNINKNHNSIRTLKVRHVPSKKRATWVKAGLESPWKDTGHAIKCINLLLAMTKWDRMTKHQEKIQGKNKLQAIVDHSMWLLGGRDRGKYEWNACILGGNRMFSLISLRSGAHSLHFVMT